LQAISRSSGRLCRGSGRILLVEGGSLESVTLDDYCSGIIKR